MVAAREFENLRLRSEEVAEFDYRPTACRKTYRMVVVRKNISVEKGEKLLFDEIVTSSTSPTTGSARRTRSSSAANDRCDQENLLAQLNGGVRALRAPVDKLESNWAYMVMTALAWNLKAWWALMLPEQPGRWQERHRAEKRWVLRLEFKTFVNAFVRLPCQIVRTGRKLVYRLVGLESAPADLLPPGRRVAVLRPASVKSESGCSDPPRRQEHPGRQEGERYDRTLRSRTTLLLAEQNGEGAPTPTTRPEGRPDLGIFACLRTRADLKALLPESGTDIKGHMRSYAELLEASGYGSRPKDFDDLIRILDSEIRLITPTDPEGKEGWRSRPPDSQGEKYYQLTHDYLVPSLRDWLTRKQKETRRGRAELLLADRAAVWNARPENRQLPSLLQWLQIRWLTAKKNWTPPQRKMMGKAGRYHAVRGLVVGLWSWLLHGLGWLRRPRPAAGPCVAGSAAGCQHERSADHRGRHGCVSPVDRPAAA